MIIPKPITKQALKKVKMPAIYKQAIEKAIDNWYDFPTDEMANCFRGEVVETERPNGLSDDDEMPDYDTEFVWFMAGWQAKERNS